MSSSFIPGIIHAEDAVPESEAYRTLSGLDMLPEGFEYIPEETFTRGEFARLLSKVLFDEELTVKDAAKKLVAYGIFAEAADMRLGDRITYEEAVKSVVTAAGYDKPANLNGGWSEGYISEARSNGFLKNVSGKMYEAVSEESAVRLILNMLDAESMETVIYSEEEIKYETSGRSVLEKYRDIKRVKGQMTANGFTELDNPGYFNLKEIKIDGTAYEINDISKFEDLLGLKVTAYYYEEKNSDKTVLCAVAEDDRAKSVTIDAELIDVVNEDTTYVEYFKDADYIKSAKLKLDPAMKVIYNKKSLAGYTKAELMPKEGSVTFTDIDSDGKYDIAKVTSYETIIADVVDTDEETIKNRYSYIGAANELDVSGDNNYVKYYFDGSEINLENVHPGDVLSVAKSRSGENDVIYIYVSREKTETKLSRYDESTSKAEIDETEYKVSEYYKLANKGNDKWGAELIGGNYYEILFDAFGKIAAAKRINADDEFYAFAFSGYKEDEDGSGEETYVLKYLSEDGKWYKKGLSKNVKLNGTSVKAEICWGEIAGINGVTRQLVRLKLNSRDEIKEIKTPQQSDTYTETKLIKGTQKRNKYFAGNRSMQGVVYVANDAVFFRIPADNADEAIKKNEKYYAVMTPIEEWYDYVPYDMDEFFNAKAFTVINSSKSGNEAGRFLVKDVKRVVNSDDLPVTQISGSFGEFELLTFNGSDESALDGIQKGDFVKLYTDANGDVTTYDSIYSVSQGTQYPSSNGQSNWGAATQWDRGIIEAIDYEKGFMKIGLSATEKYAVRLPQSATLYDIKNKTFSNVKSSSIKVGDVAVFNMSYYNIAALYLYRF